MIKMGEGRDFHEMNLTFYDTHSIGRHLHLIGILIIIAFEKSMKDLKAFKSFSELPHQPRIINYV